MNKHKRQRQQSKARQPIANKLVTINRTANNKGLIPFTFDPRNAFSVMNVSPAIFYLGTAQAHRQLFSKK